MSDDIVERLRGMVCYVSTNSEWPNVLLEEAAEEIELLREDLRIAQGHTDAAIDDYNRCLPVIRRLREEAGYAKLMYDKHMAEKLTRAEAEIEWLRGDLDRAIRYKDNNISIADVALDRAERAEDEVERLREKLSQAERYAYLANSVIEAARHHVQYCHNTESATELAEALRQLKKDPAEAGP